MLFNRCLYALLVLLLCIAQLNAQTAAFGSPPVTNFSRSDYHAGTQNWAILQAENGVMYFANNKGLIEFDGTNWNLTGLPNQSIVRSLAFGEADALYVGGQNEIGQIQFDPRTRQTYKSLRALVPEIDQSFEDVWKIFPIEDNLYWCTEKAIFCLNDGQITTIVAPGGRFENFFKVGDQIYVQDKLAGIYLLNDLQLELVLQNSAVINERIAAIFSQNDDLVLVTYSKGLYRWNGNELSFWDTNASAFLQQHYAYCAIELHNEQYAIGTTQNGVLIIDGQGQQQTLINQERGLQNNTVLSIYQDKHLNLWLGLDNGIDYVEINSPFSLISSESGIDGTGYTSLVKDGQLILGTNQGLFSAPFNSTSSNLAINKFSPVQNASGQVWGLNEIGNDLVIAQHQGTSLLRGKDAERVSSMQGIWKVMALPDHPGYAIAGTYSGFYLFERPDASRGHLRWKLIRRLEGFDESARIFEADSDGSIWVTHAYKGLFKIILQDDLQKIAQAKKYRIDDQVEVDLFVNVAKIRNEIVFTTPSGFFRHDRGTDRIVRYNQFDSIFGENCNVQRLLEDQLGNIWFLVNDEFGVLQVDDKGIFNKFDIQYFKHMQEELVDGFEHIFTYDPNHVYIGTENGFVQYDMMKQINDTFQFPVLIQSVTSITKGDSAVYYGGHPGQENASDQMSFRYEMNDFRFSYTAPYFEKIEKIEYRHRLEGFNNSWSDWSQRTEKEYTNLDEGEYAFYVQARNAYRTISDEVVYSFTIKPPWYRSTIARIIYFLLFLFLLYGMSRVMARIEKKKNEEFRIEQARKLQLKEEEFKKEAEKSEGEIVNLKNEKLADEIKFKTSQLASSTMHLVQKNEMLNKIKKDLKNLTSEAPDDLKKKIQRISKTIDGDIQLDNSWEQFELYFDQVHGDFFKTLRNRFPKLTPKDQKLCAYLRMNLATKEIAPLLNISVRGVEISRYRLRKKMDLPPETNLVSFMMNITANDSTVDPSSN